MDTNTAFKFWATVHTIMDCDTATLPVTVIMPTSTDQKAIDREAWNVARRVGQAFFGGKRVQVDALEPSN